MKHIAQSRAVRGALLALLLLLGAALLLRWIMPSPVHIPTRTAQSPDLSHVRVTAAQIKGKKMTQIVALMYPGKPVVTCQTGPPGVYDNTVKGVLHKCTLQPSAGKECFVTMIRVSTKVPKVIQSSCKQ